MYVQYSLNRWDTMCRSCHFRDATSQESLLETETARLLKAKSHASKTRENLEELLKAYHIDSRLEAERCAKS